MAEQHRTTDPSGHEAECFELHHKADNRISIMETRLATLKETMDVMVAKYGAGNDQLNKLTVLFERFFARFESHEQRLITTEQTVSEQRRTLERLSVFEHKLNAAWGVVRIVGAVSVVVLGAIYVFNKDTGILPRPALDPAPIHSN